MRSFTGGIEAGCPEKALDVDFAPVVQTSGDASSEIDAVDGSSTGTRVPKMWVVRRFRNIADMT